MRVYAPAGAKFTIKEIAEKLAVSEQTVKNQLGDITRRLRCEVGRKIFYFSYSTFCSPELSLR